MIYIFPLLTSKSVNPNVIPGVCKALELYVLVYELDKIADKGSKIVNALDMAGKAAGLFAGNAGRLQMKEAEVFLPGTKAGATQGKETAQAQQDVTKVSNAATVVSGVGKAAKEFKDKDKTNIQSVNVNQKDISLAPTWVTVTGEKGLQIVGVKVVPYLIDDTNIVELLMYDKGLNSFETFIRGAERKIAKAAYAMWHATIGKILGTISFGQAGRPTLGIDPKSDIIFGRTEFKDRVFVMLNNMSIPEDFMERVRDTKRLFSLGWKHLLINDDVQKKVTFCMKEFSGVCSSVPHKYIFTSVSKDMGEAYENLNDLKGAANPIFRQHVSGDFRKIVGESLTIVREEHQEFVGLLKSIRTGSFEKIDKEIESIPSENYGTIEKLARHVSHDSSKFDKSLHLSKQVLNNSLPELPETVNNSIAAVIAIRAAGVQDRDVMEETKDSLKTTVNRIKNYLSKDELNEKHGGIQKETIIAIIFTIIMLTGGFFLGKVLYDRKQRIGAIIKLIIAVVHKNLKAKLSVKPGKKDE